APIPEVAEGETPAGTAPDATVEKPEVEVFYTFTWAPRRQGGKPRGDRPQGKGRPRKGKPGDKRPEKQGGKTYQARPPRKEKPIDPDNPFAAALMGLKDRK
ncbi:MAG: disulfide oxidoreductase, partial [Paracoccaceae bacterium]